jgi:hypothetical protein
MAKQPTAWASRDGFSIATPASGDILLESSSYLLLENGNSIALEAITMTPKPFTSWSLPTKSATSWSTSDGTSEINSNNAGVQRYQQDGVTVRTLQDGTVRVLESSVVVPKPPTVWSTL